VSIDLRAAKGQHEAGLRAAPTLHPWHVAWPSTPPACGTATAHTHGMWRGHSHSPAGLTATQQTAGGRPDGRAICPPSRPPRPPSGPRSLSTPPLSRLPAPHLRPVGRGPPRRWEPNPTRGPYTGLQRKAACAAIARPSWPVTSTGCSPLPARGCKSYGVPPSRLRRPPTPPLDQNGPCRPLKAAVAGPRAGATRKAGRPRPPLGVLRTHGGLRYAAAGVGRPARCGKPLRGRPARHPPPLRCGPGGAAPQTASKGKTAPPQQEPPAPPPRPLSRGSRAGEWGGGGAAGPHHARGEICERRRNAQPGGCTTEPPPRPPAPPRGRVAPHPAGWASLHPERSESAGFRCP